MPSPADDIRFLRLTEVSSEAILTHMRHPRLAEHMPLLTFEWTPDRVAEFVAAKEAMWQRDGLGHWAFAVGGDYVGWGGFQKEGDEWDLGLVLTPERFGLGLPIARKALAFAREDRAFLS
ncbi:GNAT family N-acetyltransferase [Nioella aestuarii]|uniref:GNAT family N-acetyltransferase n=1 Tax=Nioella aestuarii TaxID=1662864 RepID=UPI003D7F5983